MAGVDLNKLPTIEEAKALQGSTGAEADRKPAEAKRTVPRSVSAAAAPSSGKAA